MKLKELCKQRFFIAEVSRCKEEEIKYDEMTIAAANIDDIFFALRRLKIETIEIDLDTMFLIVRFVLANITCHPHYDLTDKEFEKKINTEWNIAALKLIQDPEVDKFMGIKLILEK